MKRETQFGLIALLAALFGSSGPFYLNATYTDDESTLANETYYNLPIELLTDPEQSITGVLPYVQFVHRAVIEDEVFARFKGDKDYNQVLEHVSSVMGDM